MKDYSATSPKNQTNPISLRTNVLIQDLEKELLLYDLSRNKAFCLNETSRLIWNLCDGENSAKDISRKLSVQLKTNVSEELIWLALDKLKSEQLLDNHQEFEINFSGLSRREVIRKVGLSTIVALPFVSAIIAPAAAAAQSQAVCITGTFCSCPEPLCVITGDSSSQIQIPCNRGRCFDGTVEKSCYCTGPFVCGLVQGIKQGVCR